MAKQDTADVIYVDVPTFIRLLELAHEDVDNDMDLHDIAEKMIQLSQKQVVTMADYDNIVSFMKQQGDDQDSYGGDDEYSAELENIRRLGGMNRGS
jgi:uncharacterized short protein YbdD (DUF466 family)